MRNNDVEMLLSLIELIIGAAVMCENRSAFISRIFSLDESSQIVLKGMIEGVMTRVHDIDSEEGQNYDRDVTGGGHGDISEDLLRYTIHILLCSYNMLYTPIYTIIYIMCCFIRFFYIYVYYYL